MRECEWDGVFVAGSSSLTCIMSSCLPPFPRISASNILHPQREVLSPRVKALSDLFRWLAVINVAELSPLGMGGTTLRGGDAPGHWLWLPGNITPASLDCLHSSFIKVRGDADGRAGEQKERWAEGEEGG